MASSPHSFDTLASHVAATIEIPYEVTPDNSPQRRLLARTRQYYYSDNLQSSLPLGQFGTRALPYEALTFAFTQNLLDATFDTKLAGVNLQVEGGYRLVENLWWSPTGRVTFDPAKFYRVTEVRDPFGSLGTITYDTHALLVVSTTDPFNNTTTAEHDYRLLQPVLATDPNGNRQAIAFDALGMPIKTAVMGKLGDNDGDTLDDPTTELFYDLLTWENEQTPTYVHVKAREHHGDANTPYQETYGYTGGMGQVVMQKVQAEPGLAPKRDENGDLVFQDGELVFEDTSPDIRWIGTGRTVLDNKGNPVKQYEPFFSSTPQYENEQELVEWGVSPLLHYDPLGRVIHTDLPNGTFAKVEFTSWEQTTYDPNDTVLDNAWYAKRQALLPGTPENDAEIRASDEAAKHANTPAKSLLDNLGRVYKTIEHNLDLNQQTVFQETRLELDIEGNLLRVVDANKNIATTDTYAPGGLQLLSVSVDAGNRWALPNVVGNPLRTYDSRGFARRWVYDALGRPTHAYVRQGMTEELYERTLYGETLADPTPTNHLGQIFRVYDSAGVLTADTYDFKGNPLSQTRRFSIDYTTTPDWISLAPDQAPPALAALADPLLESESFSTTLTYDALNRPVTQTTPDASVTENLFQEGGLLHHVRVSIKGANNPTVVVSDIDYNARGQRTRVCHGNSACITYQYDPETFRVIQIQTLRQHNDPTKRRVQDLHYHYDPVGNIAEIRDNAQQGVYFQNAYVSPDQKFVYDATYRLIDATGREHATLVQPTGTDFQPISHPQDVQQQQTYRQLYAYDKVGNILEMKHIANTGWTRGYAYTPGGNRLDKNSTIGDNPNDPNTFSHSYFYDDHGNMTTMPHLQGLSWDHSDRLQSTGHSGGGTTWLVYDGSGQRVRKVHVNLSGTNRKERLYLGAWETFREHQGMVVTDERETLHVVDGMSRMCLVETKVRENSVPVQVASVQRYQYENHLGTASLELDGAGEVISYEEFHPYGTSSYRAANSAIDVSPKRYRYTGQERDEETGLGYHGARYYAPWLGRWTAADPIGLGDGVNRFAYVSGNPIFYSDSEGTEADQPGHKSIEELHAEGVSLKSFGIDETEPLPPPPESEVEEPVRTSDNKPKAASKHPSFLENLQARYQARQAAQYDANQKVAAAVQKSGDKALDTIQAGLDVVGLVEGLGAPADALNAVISVVRGDYGAAAASATAVLPVVGLVAGGVKVTRHGDEVVEAASDLARRGGKIEGELPQHDELLQPET